MHNDLHSFNLVIIKLDFQCICLTIVCKFWRKIFYASASWNVRLPYEFSAT